MRFGIIIAAGVLALGTAAMAAKTFTYTPDATPYAPTAANGNYTGAGNVGPVNVVTRANVAPFLDITSDSLSGEFAVSGFGEVVADAPQSHVMILHNQNLSFAFDNFDNLKKAGAPDIAMTVKVQTKKGDLEWYKEYEGPASGLYAAINPPNVVTPESDGGCFQVALDRKITVTNANTPGLYTNTGRFLVTAN